MMPDVVMELGQQSLRVALLVSLTLNLLLIYWLLASAAR